MAAHLSTADASRTLKAIESTALPVIKFFHHGRGLNLGKLTNR